MPLHIRPTSPPSIGIVPTINFDPVTSSSLGLSVTECCVLVDTFWLLVAFLWRCASAVVSLHHLGISICFCRSALVAGRLPLVPCVRLLRPNFPAVFAVPVLALLCMNPDRVIDLCCLCSPWLSTYQCTRGAWYRADWEFDWQVCTLCASLESELVADDWRLGEDLVEILSTYVDADRHWKLNQTC